MKEITLGKNLKYLMTKNKCTYEDLAFEINISTNTVGNIIKGSSYPRLPELVQIAEMFSVSIDSLVLGNLEEDSHDK